MVKSAYGNEYSDTDLTDGRRALRNAPRVARCGQWPESRRPWRCGWLGAGVVDLGRFVIFGMAGSLAFGLVVTTVDVALAEKGEGNSTNTQDQQQGVAPTCPGIADGIEIDIGTNCYAQNTGQNDHYPHIHNNRRNPIPSRHQSVRLDNAASLAESREHEGPHEHDGPHRGEQTPAAEQHQLERPEVRLLPVAVEDGLGHQKVQEEKANDERKE